MIAASQLLFYLAVLASTVFTMAAIPHNSISSHVLDIANGKPAVGVRTIGYRLDCDGITWNVVGNTTTGQDGRVDSIHKNVPLEAGTYKIRFETKKYFDRIGQDTFFPYVEVPFVITDASQHYHVPITLSNYGYSTYKGQ